MDSAQKFIPKHPIRLIVTDVDGTFLPKTRQLTPLTHEALAMLQARGIAVVLASSRPPRGMQFVLEDAGFMRRTEPLPVVSMNGALITTTEGTTLFSSILPSETIQRLYASVEDLLTDSTHRANLNFMLLDADEWWSSGDDDLVRREEASLRFAPVIASKEQLQERMKSRNNDSGVNKSGVNKITLLGAPDSVARAKERISAVFGADLSVSSPFNPRFLDITEQNIHKGTAILRLAEYFAIPTEEICALGDGENDIDMFRVAGTSVAMGHASEEVRREAMFVTDSHTEDGWGKAIFRLFGVER